MNTARESVLEMRKLLVPTIAAIDGFAYGWGMEIGRFLSPTFYSSPVSRDVRSVGMRFSRSVFKR